MSGEGIAGAAEEVTDLVDETTTEEEGVSVGRTGVLVILVDVGTTTETEVVVGGAGAGGVEMAGGGVIAVVEMLSDTVDLVVVGTTIVELGVTTIDLVGIGRNLGFRTGLYSSSCAAGRCFSTCACLFSTDRSSSSSCSPMIISRLIPTFLPTKSNILSPRSDRIASVKTPSPSTAGSSPTPIHVELSIGVVPSTTSGKAVESKSGNGMARTNDGTSSRGILKCMTGEMERLDG